jgi:hypothetical protein
VECTAGDDRTLWHPRVVRLFEYWLSIAPTGLLPGRQHLDPLHLGPILPNVWLLDVIKEERGLGYRYRYRLVGTAEVASLEREVTGQWFDQVHGPSSAIYARFRHMIDRGRATYRKGLVGLTHRQEHRTVENCMAPLARDGRQVDMILCCSVLFTAEGSAVV